MANKSFKDLISKAKQRDSYWVAKAIHDFTEDLFRLMEERGVNKAELARRVDASPAYITKVLRGNTNFTLETMVRLARAVDGELCVHIGRKENSVRWLDVIGKALPLKPGLDQAAEYTTVAQKECVVQAKKPLVENESPIAA